MYNTKDNMKEKELQEERIKIGLILKTARKGLGLTINIVSSNCNLDRKTIMRIEHGYNCDVNSFILYADYLNMSVKLINL